MNIQKIKLRDVYPKLESFEERGVLTAYLHEPSVAMRLTARPAVLVIPGGGYGMVSDRENEPVAMQFYAAGYQAFVLNYSVAPAYYPVQLLEAAASVHYIRARAADFCIDPSLLATLGFSAGGHLTALQAVKADDPLLAGLFGKQPAHGALMPAAAILCYPVISPTAHPHRGSFDNLSGNGRVELALLSVEKLIPKNMCPCFLWHCCDDGVVDVRNSLLFAQGLSENKIPYAMRVYERGGHGGSVATDEVLKPDVAAYPGDVPGWKADVLDWLRRHRGFCCR